MKKEFSDHLAKTFLGQKKKQKSRHHLSERILVTCLVLVCLVLIFNLRERRGFKANIAPEAQSLVLHAHQGPYAVKFDFTQSPGQMETLTIDIPQINLNTYRHMRLSLRLTDSATVDLGSLKIILSNSRRETSDHYISLRGSAWQRYNIPLSVFVGLKDKSRVNQLSFTLEPWNVRSQRGVLLIDGVEFSKN